MSLTYIKKIEVVFPKEDSFILDGQSKICNWLYNHLLDTCIKDYKENNNSLKLLTGRNLRDYAVSLKEKYPFLKTVFSSVIKEPASRLLLAYKAFFNGKRGYPKFRGWKKKWFSLFFDEPNKGWEVDAEGKTVLVSLGTISEMKVMKGKRNPSVIGTLKEKFVLKNGELVKNFRLCKQQGERFYAVFTIERCSNEELEFKKAMTTYRKELNRAKKENGELPKKPVFTENEVTIPKGISWISLDPNHKNFFVGVDHKGESIEFNKLAMIKYWDRKIDHLKSLRDICEKKYRRRKTIHGNHYHVHSPRWNRINKALNNAYHKRREQIKTALYTIAHWLYKRYDLVIIGDYTPTNGTAPFDNMKRSMLNQEKIGDFRDTLEWVSQKLEKFYIMVNERNTTRDCCVCGHKKKKTPDIRSFVCESCHTELMRDSNSSVNIAKKAGFELDIDKYKHKLSEFTYKGRIPYGKKIETNKK